AKNHSPSHRESRGDRSSPGRGAQGVLLYGLHPVSAAWLNPERRIHRLIATEAGRAALEPVLAQAKARGLQRPGLMPADRNDLDRMLPPGAVHQGVAVDVAPLDEVGIEDLCVEADSDPSALIVVLDQVTDPHNVGAILRSASAFGAKAVVVTERNAPETTGVLAKSASGALESVPLVRVTNLARALADLQQAGFWTVGLAESGASTLAQCNLTGRTALVLGAEGAGLRRLTMERCDIVARLPTQGPVGSLNVSNAAAVALYEVARLR
ncbi:23S rRNA (guanosine(2251)-2'-O)-methyltransferase RlmB, partial [Azospirillum formosense]